MSRTGKRDSRVNMDRSVVYQTTSDLDETELSAAVLLALDSVPEYDVENSDAVVFDYVDLDALDELFTTDGSETPRGQVTFPVDDFEVTVTAAGEIIIRD